MQLFKNVLLWGSSPVDLDRLLVSHDTVVFSITVTTIRQQKLYCCNSDDSNENDKNPVSIVNLNFIFHSFQISLCLSIKHYNTVINTIPNNFITLVEFKCKSKQKC